MASLFEGMFTTYRKVSSYIDIRRENLIAQLQNSLKVEPRMGTQLVDISLTDPNSKKTTKIVNKVAEIYINQNLGDKLDVQERL